MTKYFRITLILITLALITWVAITYHKQLNPRWIKMTISGFGVWAPLIFIGLYIIATLCFLPGVAMTLAGGLIFGPIFGTIYSLIGATIGSTLAFLIARYFAYNWVSHTAGIKVKTLMDGIAEEGWRFVAMMRLIPVSPFNLLNYAFGLTKIRALEFIIASAIFMLPGCFAYAYLGFVSAEAATGERGIIQVILIAIGLVGILAYLPKAFKHFRKNA